MDDSQHTGHGILFVLVLKFIYFTFSSDDSACFYKYIQLSSLVDSFTEKWKVFFFYPEMKINGKLLHCEPQNFER